MTCAPPDEQQFSGAAGVLLAWIDRGEVSRRTSNQFYSIIQLANSHVRRLMVEKAQEEEEVERAKDAYKEALLAVLSQCKNASSFLTVSQSAGSQPGRRQVSSGAGRSHLTRPLHPGGAALVRGGPERWRLRQEFGRCSAVSMTTLLHPFPHQILLGCGLAASSH